jgi:hypothetical protein
MLFAILAFSSKAQAQCPQGYETYTITLESKTCYDIVAEYCYKLSEDGKVLDLICNYVNFIQKRYDEGCYQSFDWAIGAYRYNHPQLTDEWAKRVVDEILNHERFNPVLCFEGKLLKVQLLTAACTSTEPICVGIEGGDDWIKTIYEYVPCTQEGKCKSIYEVCWKWENGSLVQEQQLLSREVVEGTCPEATTYQTDDGRTHNINCEMKCE